MGLFTFAGTQWYWVSRSWSPKGLGGESHFLSIKLQGLSDGMVMLMVWLPSPEGEEYFA